MCNDDNKRKYRDISRFRDADVTSILDCDNSESSLDFFIEIDRLLSSQDVSIWCIVEKMIGALKKRSIEARIVYEAGVI
jgi:hypothetical protein